MSPFDASQHPHRRFNALSGRWVLVSPQRSRRPWQGQQDAPDRSQRAHYDPQCYLCPGNARAEGQRNPHYTTPFVFGNDFAALQATTPAPEDAADPLFALAPARGECRVICFSPDHARTLPELTPTQRRAVVDAWCDQTRALGQRWAHVQVFENKGAMMGCSNPHPHGQVWATDRVPDEVAAEDERQRRWHAQQGRALLDAVAERELAAGERVVCAHDEWLAIVPWWASWPFETLLLPRRPWHRLDALEERARDGLAAIVGELTARYDNLFACSFPYSMGWHGAPSDGSDPAPWRVHAHFYPPLLRSASVRKFMVGYEMLAEAQRDLTPEQAAAALRAVPARHYRQTLP
jgi:UDPglucose--hexose-1-phosphate uridylyltransferase